MLVGFLRVLHFAFCLLGTESFVVLTDGGGNSDDFKTLLGFFTLSLPCNAESGAQKINS